MLEQVKPVDGLKIQTTSGDFQFSVDLSVHLLDFQPSHFDIIGRLIADSMKREQARLLCEKYGHDWPESPVIAGASICNRCHLYRNADH